MFAFPDHVLALILEALPLVDRFRNRICCRQFYRFLDPLLEIIELDELDLVYQFRQRKLHKRDYFVAIGQLLEKYGTSLVELKVIFRNFGPGKDKIVRSIIRNCPNLVHLEFECINSWGTTAVHFPVDGLMGMLNLTHLGALIRLPGPAKYDESRFRLILERIRQMCHVSWVQFNSTSGWVSACFRDQPGFKSIKGLVAGREFTSIGMAVFPNLDWFDAQRFSSPTEMARILPTNLRKLELEANYSVPFTQEDMAKLSTLVLLEEFKLDCHHKRGQFADFQFLQYFLNLRRFTAWKAPDFDSVAFANIPEKASLEHVELLHCPAVCEDVFKCMASRKYKLKSLGVEKLGLEFKRNNPLNSVEFEKLLVLNSDSLTFLVPYKEVIDDDFLQRLSDSLVLGLTALHLNWIEDNLSPNGVRRMLRRRCQLRSSAEGAGTNPERLMLMLVEEPIIGDEEGDAELVELAGVWMQVFP